MSEESKQGAPGGASVLTTEELAELRKLGEGGLDTALEWRAAALAAHPFLLDEVEALRARLSTAEKALEKTEKERLRLSALAAELHQGQCAGYRDLLDTVRSISRMLGWENPPPRESLEANLRALRARLEKAEADLSRRLAEDALKAQKEEEK